MDDRVLNDFIELVSLPAKSGDERQVADRIKDKLLALGLEVSEDRVFEKIGGNTGNVFAVLKGDSRLPVVLLSSHMDRVPNNGHIRPQIDAKEGVLRTDGKTILAADDVAGLCAILETLRRLKAEGKPHGDVEVLLTVSEEAGLFGSKEADYSGFKAKIGFVPDCPGRVGKVVNQAPSGVNFEITINGLPAHAGNEPEKGIDAIKVVATALVNLPTGRLSPTMTSNFGVIQGGKVVNVVCARVTLLGEARSTDEVELDTYIEKVKTVFADTAQAFGATVEVKVEKNYPTYQVAEDSVVIRALKVGFEAEGIPCTCMRSGGGSDANWFNQYGIESVPVAVGYFENHTTQEHVYVEDISACARVMARAIQHFGEN